MKRKAFCAALPYSLPICVGFFFIAMSYGILTRVKGLSVFYPAAMSTLIYAGSMEFVTVDLLLSPFSPVGAFLLAVTVNARHLFYGIAMLDRYRGTGWKKPYLIFGMCDETFLINCNAAPPPDVDRGWFMFFVTLLDQAYWVTGAVVGSLVGTLIRFDTAGIEFVMTALFVVMLVEKWEDKTARLPVAIGVGCTLLCLLLLGSSRFLIVSMLLIVAAAALLRGKMEGRE